MKKVIEVKNLTKKYKELIAIDDLSFDVYKGEILGLLGPNGSGKTTTINCLLSLLEYQSGEITIFDKEMTPSSYDIKREIGVVFQEVAVFDELTVYENIDYFCGLYIDNPITRKKYVEDAIKLVGLENFSKFVPKKLSGGLLRRLNIACGISHKPKLIFLDEPTVAVDPQSRNNILNGIRKLNKEGATIIYTSHYMDEVEELCHRIIILDNGKIIAQGTKEELKEMIGISLKVVLSIDNLTDELVKDLEKINNVIEVKREENDVYMYYKKGKTNLEDLVEYIKVNKIICTRLYSEQPSLNDVFLELTGRELRDQ
jgi:ABC-2 type transport system ATP-binding protein